ncbi:MAG: hypothetical protein LBG60_17630 [Bifidobacteriaceae bacterium]|jgi:hypothetical protein|nr:hypothetical protein [Bifidobacteriaceae bacterium]
MTTPEHNPQYPQPQPPQAYYQQPPPPYGQQNTGAVPYPPYPQPKTGSPIAGGVWGIVLLALAALTTLIGLITLIVSVTGGGAAYHDTAPFLTTWFLMPGLILSGLFLALQAFGAKKN